MPKYKVRCAKSYIAVRRIFSAAAGRVFCDIWEVHKLIKCNNNEKCGFLYQFALYIIVLWRLKQM
jgi:hypothetical protein